MDSILTIKYEICTIWGYLFIYLFLLFRCVMNLGICETTKCSGSAHSKKSWAHLWGAFREHFELGHPLRGVVTQLHFKYALKVCRPWIGTKPQLVFPCVWFCMFFPWSESVSLRVGGCGYLPAGCSQVAIISTNHPDWDSLLAKLFSQQERYYCWDPGSP